MLVLVFTQVFEQYGDVGKPCFKKKFGDNYECIIPDNHNVTNAVQAMFDWITNNVAVPSTLEKSKGQHDFKEFPTAWEFLHDDQKTDMEAQYAQFGDKFPLNRLQYDPEHAIITSEKAEKVYV